MFEINTKLSELIGILIGDGNIYYNTKIKKYFFEITGDPKLEVEYFDYVSSLVQEIINKKPIIAGSYEIELNRRARSAKLRIIKKI